MAKHGEVNQKEPVTVNLQGSLSLRAYPDRRPGNLELAGIHKALILLCDGVELVEEGAGFGLPIAIFRDKTFFPGSATLKTIQLEPYPILEKTYVMDTVSTKTLSETRISDTIYHPVHRVFSALYLNLNNLRPVFDKIIELRDIVGVKTSFLATGSRGWVKVRYTIHPDHIEIEARSEIVEGYRELIFLNEQGASTFRVCREGSSTFIDDDIGAWSSIDVSDATFSSLDGGLSFNIEKPRDAVFRRGRERVRGRLSWAGFSLSYGSSDPIKYTIKINQTCLFA